MVIYFLCYHCSWLANLCCLEQRKKNEKYIETNLIQKYNSLGRICVFSLKDWN